MLESLDDIKALLDDSAAISILELPATTGTALLTLVYVCKIPSLPVSFILWRPFHLLLPLTRICSSSPTLLYGLESQLGTVALWDLKNAK